MQRLLDLAVWKVGNPPIAVALLALLFALPSGAGTSSPLPEGHAVGRWIFAPWLAYDYEVEDNVFRAADSQGPQSDEIDVLSGGVVGYLPFRRSMFIVDLEASQLAYQTNTFTRDTDFYATAEGRFNLSTHDSVGILGHYTDAFSDIGDVDPGGEIVFRGEPYIRKRFDVELQRAVPLRAGYYARFSYIDQRFTDDDATAFFDYEGYDIAGEYRQPLASYKWIVVYYNTRKFDNFKPGESEAFRQENSDTVQLGLRGVAGKNQPFVVRVGWGRFKYEILDRSEFTGITLFTQWRLAIGGRSTVDLSAYQRPLPSDFNTYYNNTQLTGDFARAVGRYSELGIRARYDHNAYGDPIAVSGCGVFIRDDRRYELEGSLTWRLHKRFGYEMSVGHERRDSNCSVFSYEATVASAGVRFGWF